MPPPPDTEEEDSDEMHVGFHIVAGPEYRPSDDDTNSIWLDYRTGDWLDEHKRYKRERALENLEDFWPQCELTGASRLKVPAPPDSKWKDLIGDPIQEGELVAAVDSAFQLGMVTTKWPRITRYFNRAFDKKTHDHMVSIVSLLQNMMMSPIIAEAGKCFECTDQKAMKELSDLAKVPIVGTASAKDLSN